jgi:hypothetical protein
MRPAASDSKINEAKQLEACIAIALFFLVVGELKARPYYFFASAGALVIALLAMPARRLIGIVWYKIPEIIGPIMTNIILSIFFFAVLFPMAQLKKFSGADPLNLKRPGSGDSLWKSRGHVYVRADLERTW